MCWVADLPKLTNLPEAVREVLDNRWVGLVKGHARELAMMMKPY